MTPAKPIAASFPLLETKVHAPRRRRGVVARGRLDNRFTRGEQPALTLVSAPAGFGKTTLLSEWFSKDAIDASVTAWLSLDPSDNEPALFWTYVIAALQTIAPDVGADALALLQSPHSSIDAVVASLLNDLNAIPQDVVLVLDDYHVIESRELHDAMAFVLERLPPNIHVVLAGRSDPPLPLARMRARGQLFEIRAADLRFTVDEAATYFNEAMGLHLTARDVGALEARTEGWIAALQLAALSMQGRDDIARFVENFTGDDRFVVDYLVEEVLERQSDDVRRFLLETAVLNRFTGSLCDAVTGRSGGASTLEMLDRANLFVVALDDRRLWYRYHHLFADVLRARLLSEQPEQVHVLHRRASDWYEANGDRPEAIGHAIAGEDFERAAELIERAAPMMRQSRQESTLRRWLEAIPSDLLEARPVLSTALVGARMATGDSTGVTPLLQSAERWFDAPRDSTQGPIVFDEEEFSRLPAQVSMYRAALSLLAGDIAGTIAHAGRIFELAEPSDHLRFGGASALMGLARWATGDLERARDHYANAVESFTKADFIADVLGCSLALADIQIAQGKLRDAYETFARGLELAHGQPGLRGTADMHVGLSELLLDRDEVDAARGHLQQTAELGEHAGLPQNPYRRRAALARLLQVEGDLAGALELIDEAERVYNTDFSPPVRPIHALRARLHLARGDLAAALRWAADHDLTADDELSYVREYEHVTLARALLARHHADRTDRSIDVAIGLLDRLLAAAEEGTREGSVVEILVLLSRAHHARGDRTAAVASLEQALVRAEPEGFVRVFVDAGPSIVELLRSSSLRGVAGRQAQRVLAAIRPAGSTPPKSPSPRHELVDELSSRELEVLRLLRSELSGPDIARELMVSLNTMRTHTKNIYVKLGVNNRREAVRRAGELGL